MPFITFTSDVWLPGESGGPHYKKGYIADVTGNQMREWVGRGFAVLGAIEIKPTEEQPEKPRTGRRKSVILDRLVVSDLPESTSGD